MSRFRFLLLAAMVGLALPSTPARAQLLSGKLLYNSIQPCRVLDTRGHHGPIAAGGTLTFAVVGNGDLSPQGGSATGCSIPGFANGKPQALAVMINFIAVGAQGPGDLRAYPSDGLLPNASVINYAQQNLIAGLNIANGIVVPLGQTTQGQDITLQADVSATQVVADVVGYFTKATRRYYVTVTGFHPAQAPTACAAGFHFASMFEIRSPELLQYDASLGATDGFDVGSGPVSSVFGWVRTGVASSNSGTLGQGNCNLWTSSSAADSGTAVSLDNVWTDAATVISPWRGLGSPVTCDIALPVWCVED